MPRAWTTMAAHRCVVDRNLRRGKSFSHLSDEVVEGKCFEAVVLEEAVDGRHV
jgi:hypothetical protein